jgi:hypothetical protein
VSAHHRTQLERMLAILPAVQRFAEAECRAAGGSAEAEAAAAGPIGLTLPFAGCGWRRGWMRWRAWLL